MKIRDILAAAAILAVASTPLFVAHAQAGEYDEAAIAILRDAVISHKADTAAGIVPEIKADCAVEWPNDYRMQKHCHDRQVEAMVALNQMRAFMTPIQEEIALRCAGEWVLPSGNYDYRMVKYCWEKQVDAYDAMHSSGQ